VEGFFMAKKEVIKKSGGLPPELEGYMNEYLKHKSVKNMDDVQEMMRGWLGPIMQKLLDAEMESKIGYAKNERSEFENSRNGYYPERAVNTAYGEMPVKIPRDRMGEVESDLIPKYSRSMNGFEEKVIAMYGLGMTESEISEQIYDLFGCKLTDDMISDITDKILPDIQDWQKRKLDKVYPIVFIDATHFSVRDNGTVIKKAAYITLGINSEGLKDVLSITVGENESAKVWMNILTDLKNRGLQDVLIICADGLTGIKDAISAVYPKTEYQRCIVHQIRNSLKFVSYKDRKEMVEDMKPIYTASSEENGYKALLEFEEKWIKKYPNAVNSWINNWDVLSTFFKFSPELRKIMYTTNAIESLNNRYKSANKKRPVFPTNNSLLKVLYLTTIKMVKKWSTRIKDWDMILNQLKIMYDNRI
jgi:putative transposase